MCVCVCACVRACVCVCRLIEVWIGARYTDEHSTRETELYIIVENTLSLVTHSEIRRVDDRVDHHYLLQ